MNNYYMNKAKEDSKNDHLLKVINLKSEALARIYDIQDIYLECHECKEIFRNELSEMMKKLRKQNELRKTNIAGLLPKEGEKYLIGNPPALIGRTGDVEIRIINYQKQYLENFKVMKPGYFFPCDKHFKLAREWENLEIKIKDYEAIIKNNPNMNI